MSRIPSITENGDSSISIRPVYATNGMVKWVERPELFSETGYRCVHPLQTVITKILFFTDNWFPLNPYIDRNNKENAQ